MTRVRVGVRVRPLNEMERNSGVQEVTKICSNMQQHRLELSLPSKNQIHTTEKQGEEHYIFPEDTRSFSFDFCLSETTASQSAVYETVGQPTLKAMLGGYNSCIFAYGQSGTGKSYTVTGNQSEIGLLSRICQALFEETHRYENKRKFCIEVSFLELYKERIHDLLQSSRTLRLREHPQLGPFAEGLMRRRVCSVEDVNKLLHEIQENRLKLTSQDQGRKSHLVFSLRCHQELLEQNRNLMCELHLVDLAGSERLQQVSNVNKSLVTLGIVISALGESCKRRSPWSCSRTPLRNNTYVPFRSSALTWLLKETLGGNCVTCVIATISPCSCCYKDTLSTLRYAERIRSIRNRPVVNERSSHGLRRVRKEVKASKKILSEAVFIKDTPQLKVAMSQSELEDLNSDKETILKAQAPDCSPCTSAGRMDSELVPAISRFRSEASLHQLTCFYVIRRALTFNTCLASSHGTLETSVNQLASVTNPPSSNNVECLLQECFDSESGSDKEGQQTICSFDGCSSPSLRRINLRDERCQKSGSCDNNLPRSSLSKEYSQSCPALKVVFDRLDNESETHVKLTQDPDASVDDAVDYTSDAAKYCTRERLSSCYSTDSVEGYVRPNKPNESTNPNNRPFRLGQNSSSPEPPMFLGSEPPVKPSNWSIIPVPTVQKYSPTSSLDSITYVFLDSAPGSSQDPTFTQNWVSQSVLQNRRVHHPSSLSTVDSLEVDNVEVESRKSPRTLSVDSILLEECLNSVRKELPEQDKLEPRIPCESSGISSKSDSSSISVQSGSSSTTRRRDSFGIQSTFVPPAQVRIQTDLIQLMTEVVQLLASQQRAKKSCRCHHRKPRVQKLLPINKGCTQLIKLQPESGTFKKSKTLLEQEIRTLRQDRAHVKRLLEEKGASPFEKQWCFPDSRPEVSLPSSITSSRNSKDDQEEIIISTKAIIFASNNKLSNTAKSQETINQLARDPCFPQQLHDSGVDCCSEPTSPNQAYGLNGDDDHLNTSQQYHKPPQVSQETAHRKMPSFPLRPQPCKDYRTMDWSSRSEADKDRLLTRMERELDLLERTLAPLDYRPLPDRFTNPSSFAIPIPKEFR